VTTYMPEIRLTVAQRLILDWAADPMRDFWLDAEERRDEGYWPIEFPVKVTALGVLVANCRGVLEDLKYRLLEQYPDVVDEMEHGPRIATVRAASNAWKAIAKVAAVYGHVDVEAA
jgi:hypothetical protein